MKRWNPAAIVLLMIGCSQEPPPPEDDGADDGATELVVDFKDDVSAEDIERIERELGINLTYNSEHAYDEVLTITEHLPRERMSVVARQLEESGLVEAAEPNAMHYVLLEHEIGGSVSAFEPNDPQYPAQWHLAKIGMPEAWVHAQGDGVIVAVLDTGVAYEDHKSFTRAPDLAETTFVAGYNFVSDTVHANDDHGHGTHVAGTIAQSTNNGVGVAGVAFKAQIMPVKVLSRSGGGTTSDIADAIRFAADNGAKVINMSLGGGARSSVLASAVAYAHKKGVLVACAAGNGGRRKVEYPAAYKGAFAVSSTGPTDTLAFYSSYGPEVAVAAPGGDKSKGDDGGVLQQTIVRGDPSRFAYEWYQGTSMATPHVAGVAALVFSAGATKVEDVERILTETADDLGERGRDDKYGHGRINAAKAVAAARALAGTSQEEPTERAACMGMSAGTWLVIAFAVLMVFMRRFRRNVAFLGVSILRQWRKR